VCEGSRWFKHRRIITPTFHFSVLENFCEVFGENANVLVNELNKLSAAAGGTAVDVYPLITKAALDIICGKSNNTFCMTYQCIGMNATAAELFLCYGKQFWVEMRNQCLLLFLLPSM